MNNINVFYIFGTNYGVIGNTTASVTMHYASDIHNSNIVQGDGSLNISKPFSDFEKELLRLFSGLGIIDQSRVLIYAAGLKDKQQEDTKR